MKVMVFGGTGMLGQGVLRECFNAADVSQVLSVGRSPLGLSHARLRELQVPDASKLALHEASLSGYDACFFCLGVSSSGMSEADYHKITYDYTLTVARLLARLNPQMTFIYVSGAGTDSTEKGRVMWARVKGATENALLALPFKGAYMLRPGIIQPLHGATSKTKSYRIFYTLARPVLPVLRKLLPGQVSTTEQIGKVMLALARQGNAHTVLESSEINRMPV
ncbi:epimerase [Silvimonas iriomotensis]|uniref:Epimerase n=1 Tax=Silvimonas iriomotensis TaxID=449662 RepID=A0ABQ2PCH1_9NEIS|nr:epimerase [Silvimonas iriomotensis]GGP23147.1 epimerase [Silvimonas iriomotensis]